MDHKISKKRSNLRIIKDTEKNKQDEYDEEKEKNEKATRKILI